MKRQKLELKTRDLELIAGALWQYKATEGEDEDYINELRLHIESEGIRLENIARRKANGLHEYVFHDADGKEIACAELQNDGNAWEYIYKTLARYYPTGVTFEVFD